MSEEPLEVGVPEDEELYQEDGGTSQDEEAPTSKTPHEGEIPKSPLRLVKAGSKRGFDLVDLHVNQSENSWSLPAELAEIFNKNATRLIPHQVLKENILELHPVPDNLVKKPEMDTWLPPLMNLNPIKGESARQQKRDEFLGESWECIIKIMGPLGRLWSEVEEKKKEVENMTLPEVETPPDNLSPEQEEIQSLKLEIAELRQQGVSQDLSVLSEMAALLQQSMTLTGQAANKVTYLRRLLNYSTLKDVSLEDAKKKLKERDSVLSSETEFLFGENFSEKAKLATAQVRNIQANVRIDKDLKDLSKGKQPSAKTAKELGIQPFQASSASSSSSPGRGRSARGASRANLARGHSQGGGRHQDGGGQPYAGLWNNNNSNYTPRGECGSSSCPPFSRSPMLPWFRKFLPWRKNKRVFQNMESAHQRPRDSLHSLGVANSMGERPSEGKGSTADSIFQSRERGDQLGNRKNAQEKSNISSSTSRGSGPVKCVHKTEIRFRVQNHIESEKAQSIDPLPTFQNGGDQRFEKSLEEGRLHGKIGSPGRVLECSNTPGVKEIPEIPLGGNSVRICGPGLRAGTRTQNLYEADEGSDVDFERVEHPDNNLHRRYADHGLLPRGYFDGKRYYYRPFESPRFHDKPCQILFDSIAMLRVSWDANQQHLYDNFSPREQNREADFPMQGNNGGESNLTPTASQSDRKASGDSPSYPRSNSPNQRPSTEPYQSSEVLPELRVSHDFIERGVGRVELVDSKPDRCQRGQHSDRASTNGDIHRCLEEGMGSSCERRNHSGGPMVSTGETLAHKCARVEGSGTSLEDSVETQFSEISPHENRQHLSTVLPSQERGNEIPCHEQTSQVNLVIPKEERSRTHSQLDSFKGEQRGRRKVSPKPKLKRLASPQGSLQNDHKRAWNPYAGLFRIKNDAPGPKIHESLSGPLLHSSKCNVSGMEPRVPISVPSILPDRKCSKQTDSKSGAKSNPGSPSLARTAMVPNVAAAANKCAHDPPSLEKFSKERGGKNSRSRSGKTASDVCLSSHRASLVSRGFSERAANLILSARRGSTSRTYSAPWRKWNDWCGERSLDPYKAPITEIADFLSECFAEGLSASYIGVIRSTISSYHSLVEGYTVGKHPDITLVLSGVKTSRPPRTVLPMVWSCDRVLEFLKSLGNTQGLSLKMLSWRTVMLICLSAIPRASEIVQTRLSMLSELPESWVFFFKDPTKNERERSSQYRLKDHPQLEIFRFSEDVDLCPISHLEHYRERTSDLRKKEDKIFLSYIKPHQGIVSETMGSWVKQILKLSGIDVSKFSAHSVRHASSSLAKKRGISIKNIMDKGRWSSSSVWQKFYYKEVPSDKEKFHRAVFQNFRAPTALK